MTSSVWSRAFVPLALALFLSCCTQSPAVPGSKAPPPPEITDRPYLFEIVRYLYRWELDEAEIDRVVGEERFVFWVRRVEPQLDAGDESQLGEILLPQFGLAVLVKKSNYAIEELGVAVKSERFVVSEVVRQDLPQTIPTSCHEVDVEMSEMRDYLFRTRNDHDYPDATLVQRLRDAMAAEEHEEEIHHAKIPAGDQIVHLAPLSPVSNEVWVFWESGRKLLHFASDIDLTNPEVWKHERLLARIYDLDTQVVVSHEEAPGSNRFLTRHQVGRAMYNCIVLGQRLEVPPFVPAP